MANIIDKSTLEGLKATRLNGLVKWHERAKGRALTGQELADLKRTNDRACETLFYHVSGDAYREGWVE